MNNQIPVLTSGELILSHATAAGIRATGSNVFTLQNGVTGDLQFYSSSNKITSSGALTIAGGFTSNSGTITLGGLGGGGTQCVQVSNTGVLSGTGAGCGTASVAWNALTNPTGTQTLTFDDGELNSWTVNYGYGVVLWISIISLIISTIAVYLIPGTKAIISTEETQYFTLLRKGLDVSLKNVSILQIIIFVSLAQALFGALDEYWSIFANEAGLIKSGLGIFFALYGLVQVVATAIAYKFEKRSDVFFQFLFLVNGLLLLVASYFYKVPFLALLLLLSFLFKLVDIVMQSRLQHQVKEESVRATITSVKGFFVELAVMGLYLTMGLVS